MTSCAALCFTRDRLAAVLPTSLPDALAFCQVFQLIIDLQQALMHLPSLLMKSSKVCLKCQLSSPGMCRPVVSATRVVPAFCPANTSYNDCCVL